MRWAAGSRKRAASRTARLLPTLDEFGGSQSFAGPVRQRRIAANGCAETELAAGLPFAIAPNVRPRPVPNRKHQPGDCMVVGLSVELFLERREGGGRGLPVEVALQRLVGALDLATGLRVIGPRVLGGDPKPLEL